ncbi:DHA2 family efflux MFS transporter permease subunit [Ktedonosporobacter rubrisoli]|uniref:DHA2 family efflux MFS transporter permease subunit n=1 Tax=Ktedonosporobacter rubrisoli TaxID=2509675 RepID=A0A4P6JPQ5_KTERU|nr:MDR family MFS transporter [Ktedonosporobacter rubrisoli]QBD77130.1 DHA2 family efflux MFS transporter permease subunit [Ktedonosporobacter rubrisoli]
MKLKKNTHTIKSVQVSTHRLHGPVFVGVIIALLLTLLLEALDQTIVGTALPKIIADLQGFDRYTWVVNAYLLATTAMIPIVGKLSDLFGRKWFLVIGVMLFLLGSALCGLAQTMNQLIAFRAMQGLGSGIGLALVMTIVGDIFPPVERARWQSILSSVYGFANLIGPTLGGWLADHGPLLGTLVTETTRWRWIFYINLPIGLLALVILLLCLPIDISERSQDRISWAAVRGIDFTGALLVATATICLLLGLTWGGDASYGWQNTQVIVILAIAGILYLLFLFTELKVADPIVPLDLFRNQVFTAASLLNLLQGMVLLGLTIYLPLFLQGVLGVSATNSGALLTPMLVSATVVALFAGFASSILKRYQWIAVAGAIVMGAGVFLLTQMTPSTSLLLATISMLIAGIGMGVFLSIAPLAAQNALPRTQFGVGMAAARYMGQLGPTLGVALVGTVVNSSLSSELARRLPASTIKHLTPAGIKLATDTQALVNPAYQAKVIEMLQRHAVEQAANHLSPGPAQQAALQVQHLLSQVFEILRLSLAVALQHGFWTIFILCGATLLMTFFLKDVPMTASSPAVDKPETVLADPQSSSIQ